MKFSPIVLILFFAIINPFAASCQVDSLGMTNDRLDQLIKSEVDEIEGVLGAWQFMYAEKLIIIITDEKANRMRIFSPVIESDGLVSEDLEKMLVANFHSALDAKYSVYEGFVVSVYTHPLKELTDTQFIDAMRQVALLNLTYGTSYQSTDIVFPGAAGRDGEEKPRVNERPSKDKNIKKS